MAGCTTFLPEVVKPLCVTNGPTTVSLVSTTSMKKRGMAGELETLQSSLS